MEGFAILCLGSLIFLSGLFAGENFAEKDFLRDCNRQGHYFAGDVKIECKVIKLQTKE